MARRSVNRTEGRSARLPRVLIVEAQSPSIAGTMPASTFDRVVTSSLGEARAALAQGGWDAFMVDLSLPDGSGLDLLESIRQSHPSAPTVVMTNGAVELSSEQLDAYG